MKIDKAELNRHVWYEDENGDIIPEINEYPCDPPQGAVTYHSMFPLEITEHVYSFNWYPERKIDKLLYKIPAIRRYLDKKHKNDKVFHHLANFNTTIGGDNQDVIMAMVNSGDYTLNEAIMLLANSCERCMNVLAYKYLNGKDGYPEYSEEWKKCNTICRFCEEDNK